MKQIKLSAAALAVAFFANMSYAEAPVTDLSSQPTATTITAANSQSSSTDNSSTSVGSANSSQVQAPNLQGMNFDDTADLTQEQRIARLERMFNARSSSQLQIRQQLNQLSDRLAQINGQIEQQQHQIAQIVKRQRDLYQELERRLSDTKPSAQSTDAAGQKNAADNEPVIGGDGEADYENAVKLVMQDRKFDEAISAFETFLTQHPKSSYLPNAHYWLGQLQFTQGHQDKALAQFETVVKQFPDSNKVPESLLKLGQLVLQSKNVSQAKDYFNKVIQNYPQSSAADLAKNQLKSLK
ncbi:tol-pal system protein YbgF [Celerinatantimonas sp. MCCC 1A17872]|uniref:tol-pal system protein YbgF n=1 Tax=Celerinatantimonas sp. MCCC 1A17872 TaxID=3177514 RepID=UPI0038C4D97D